MIKLMTYGCWGICALGFISMVLILILVALGLWPFATLL